MATYPPLRSYDIALRERDDDYNEVRQNRDQVCQKLERARELLPKIETTMMRTEILLKELKEVLTSEA